MIAIASDASAASYQPRDVASAPNTAILRLTALMAGGSLVAASATLLSIAGDFPHPGHQALAALVTLLLALMVTGSGWGIPNRSYRATLFRFRAYTLLVIALPTVRYVPFVYTFAYLQDLESLFPPLWPYFISIPLLFALVGELTYSRRQRTAPLFLLAASLVPASMLLLFGSSIIQAMAATPISIVSPWRVLLAIGIFVPATASIVLGTAAAARGVAWAGATVLLGTGLFLETVSTFLYGTAALKFSNPDFLPISPWTAFLAGTVPGALTLLLSVAVVAANASRRRASNFFAQ